MTKENKYFYKVVCLIVYMKKEVVKFFAKNRKAIVTDYLPWLIIGLAVLAIVFIAILLLKDKGVSFIDYVKDLFRGRGG